MTTETGTQSMGWTERASCHGMDPDLFFPGSGELAPEAKAACAQCEVRRECLEWALTHRERGIWGGLNERERRTIRRRRAAALRRSAA